MELNTKMLARVPKRNLKSVDAHFLHRGKWWVAWTDDVPGALTQGRTLREARENLKDAVALMLEPAELDSLPKGSRLIHERLAL
jgi:predicted RNase H-like HicB family nuclease